MPLFFLILVLSHSLLSLSNLSNIVFVVYYKSRLSSHIGKKLSINHLPNGVEGVQFVDFLFAYKGFLNPRNLAQSTNSLKIPSISSSVASSNARLSNVVFFENLSKMYSFFSSMVIMNMYRPLSQELRSPKVGLIHNLFTEIRLINTESTKIWLL